MISCKKQLERNSIDSDRWIKWVSKDSDRKFTSSSINNFFTFTLGARWIDWYHGQKTQPRNVNASFQIQKIASALPFWNNWRKNCRSEETCTTDIKESRSVVNDRFLLQTDIHCLFTTSCQTKIYVCITCINIHRTFPFQISWSLF